MGKEKLSERETVKKAVMERLSGEVYEEIKPVIESRDRAEAKLYGLRETLEKYRTRESVLSTRIQQSMDDLAEKLGRGLDVAGEERELRELRADVLDRREWIEKLSKEMIPQTEAQLTRCFDNLVAVTRSAMTSAKKEHGAKLDAIALLYLHNYLAWEDACAEFYSSNRIHITPGTRDEMLASNLSSDDAMAIKNLLGYV